MAFDAATGKKLWEARTGSRFSNDRGDGPRATPTVDGDRVYAFGASGDLSVLDAATGKVIWTGQRAEAVRRLEHPVGAQRIAARAERSDPRQRRRPGASIVALKKTDGSLIWKSQRRRGRVLVGRAARRSAASREAIYFTGQRALGVDVDNGRLLWSYDQRRQPHRQHRHADRPRQPRVPLVRLRHRRGAAGADRRQRRRSARSEVYFTRDMRNHHASSVLVGDYLYGFSDAILTAMKFDTGKVAWRDRSVGKGSVVVRRRSALSLQRKRRRRPGRGDARPAIASTAASRSRPAACRPGATRSSRAASCSCGIRTRFTRTT